MSIIFSLKGILIGDTETGKSQLITQYCNKRFNEEHNPTRSIQNFFIYVEGKGIKVHLQILDTAGQGTFRQLNDFSSKKIGFCMLVFDLTNRQTFENISGYYEKVVEIEKLTLIVVGNKSDLVDLRQVSSEEAQVLCDNYGFIYYECSAMDYNSVSFLFKIAIQYHIDEFEDYKAYL